MSICNRPSFKSKMASLQQIFETELFPENYFEVLNPILELLPEELIEGFIFETVLGEKRFFPDFSVHFTLLSLRKIALTDIGEKLRGGSFEYEVWKRVCGFWEEWLRPDTSIRDIKNSWLEFDVSEGVNGITIPSVFFRVDASRYQDWIVEKALNLLNGEELPLKVVENLKKCFARLPPGTVVSQVGMMLPRNLSAIRVYLKNIDIRVLPYFLLEIQFPGDIGKVDSLAREIVNLGAKISLQLDVGETIGDVVALEAKIDQEHGNSRLLHYLENRGLCHKLKSQLIMSWKKHIEVSFLRDRIDLIKYVSHIKFVISPKTLITAKGYLGVYFLPSQC